MPRSACVLDGQSLAVEDVVHVAHDPTTHITLDPEARRALVESRRVVDRAISSGQTIYGINTGFGKLANVRVPPDQLDQLQANLIRSHAAGVGNPLPPSVVRAVMLLRANVLLRPTSGVRPELVEALVALLNAGVLPLVPEQGSLPASGALLPISPPPTSEGNDASCEPRKLQLTRHLRPHTLQALCAPDQTAFHAARLPGWLANLAWRSSRFTE